MPRKPTPPTDTCPFCGLGTSLQIAVTARHGRSALLRSMWCASCRGTYLALRRLLPDVRVVDTKRTRPIARFNADKLRLSIAEPLRKPPKDGLRDPYTLDRLIRPLEELAPEFVFDFVAEGVAKAVPEPNGQISTDQIAVIAMAALHRTHVLAFLRSAVHHRLFPLAATEGECEELAELAEQVVRTAQMHNPGHQPELPALREPPAPVLCPRCGAQRVARRSRAINVRGLDQQPASCSNCGQRYTWEWGSQMPLLVTSDTGEALFDLSRFRAGIRNAVRKLPGAAAIWSDEKLVASAASTALASATPYIQSPTSSYPLPSIDTDDLWLSAASALRSIHPLAFVRYAVYSGTLTDLDWKGADRAARLSRMEAIVVGIARRYFELPSFPDIGL